jgi:transmembrane sensor
MTQHDPQDGLDRMNSQTTIASDEGIADLDLVRREAYEWIARFVSGEMTSAEVGAMKAWFAQSAAHRNAYAEARRVWCSLGPIASESSRGPRKAGQGGMASVRRPASAPVPTRRLVLGGALAASAAYLVVKPPLALWPSYTELLADFRTGIGEQRQLMLADNVSVDLNTRTSIAVRSRTAAAVQIELLSGETAISTGAGAPQLTVIAASGRVVATDAEFNLRCDGTHVSVSCLKGQLDVERDGLTTPLSEGQQIGYGNREIGTVYPINPEIVTAWQHGLLIFDRMPVAQVISEVNRYRPGRIVLLNSEIGQRLLNARLRIAEADKIVVQIVRIFAVKARTLPGGIVLLT